MRASTVLLTAGLAAALACQQEPTLPTGNPRTLSSGDVAISRVQGGIRLTNQTGQAVAYAVWNRDWLALFAPCVEPAPACVRLAPQATIVVPDGAIGGYVPGVAEAIVRWWHVLPDGAGGFRAGEVHEVLVGL